MNGVPSQELKTKVSSNLVQTIEQVSKGWFIEGWDIIDYGLFEKLKEQAKNVNSAKTYDELDVLVKSCIDKMLYANKDQYDSILQDFRVNRPIYAMEAKKDKYAGSPSGQITDKEVNNYINTLISDVKSIYDGWNKSINSTNQTVSSTINTAKKSDKTFETSKNVKVQSTGGFEQYSLALTLYKQKSFDKKYDAVLDRIFSGSNITSTFISHSISAPSMAKYEKYVKDFGQFKVDELVKLVISILK